MKDLKKILNDWEEECDGCLEKGCQLFLSVVQIKFSVVDVDTDRDRHPRQNDPDPADPERYQFHAIEKVGKLNFFLENFNMLSKILIYDTFV